MEGFLTTVGGVTASSTPTYCAQGAITPLSKLGLMSVGPAQLDDEGEDEDERELDVEDVNSVVGCACTVDVVKMLLPTVFELDRPNEMLVDWAALLV
jgi:hypothetical protein